MRTFTRKPYFGKPGRGLCLLLVVLATNGVLIPQRLSAAVAYVQGNYATPQTPQATVQVTYTNAQNAGDLSVVIVGWNDTTAVVNSVSDTKGNTYQLAVGPTRLSGALSQSIYYAGNIGAAAANGNKVTVTFSKAAIYPDIRVLEYSGIDTNTPFDVAVGATGTGGTSSSGAVTTTNAADLLVGANMVQDYTTGPGPNFTKRIVTSPDGDIAEDWIVTATGSYSASASVAGSSGWVAQLAAFRAAGSQLASTGAFGPVIQWPIIPIHMVLLPDGRVFSYGTDQSGNQGAALIYDVWNPALGTGANAHSVLPNTTSTDLFCSGHSLMTNGNVLTTGGDLTVGGQRNFANNLTTIFMPASNTITSGTPMTYPRWYPSLVSLSDGRLAVFGGYQNIAPPLNNPVIPATTPEVYDLATQAWTVLSGASSDAAFGGGSNWYYPKSYVAPGGNVFVLGADGTMYSVSTAGAGSITQFATTMPSGSDILPTISFAPGKLLSVRSTQVFVADYTQPNAAPVVTQTDNIDQYRYYASGTILADGKVFIDGGSTVPNQLTGVAYQAQIWNPATGHWTAGATATQARLYHSNALLLPDATVLTTGGGAPGPVNNLNGEIYSPYYLYTSSGQLAVRPVISSVTPQTLLPGNTINLTLGSAAQISRLTFIRTGSATHNNNSDQRFINLSFQQSGQQLTATLPSDPTVLVPGYYMLFAFNSTGVPSKAQVVLVNPPNAPPPPTQYVVQNGYNCPQGTYNYPAVTLSETAGNMNVVVIGWNDNVTSISSVTDSQGNTYTQAVPVVRYPASGGSGAVSQAIYYTPHVKAGANNVTVTFAAPVLYPDLRVLELHGVDAADVSASAGGNGKATSSGTINPSTPGLIISAVTTSDGVVSAAAGWNLVTITRPDSDSVATQAGAGSPGGTAFTDGGTLGGSGIWVSQMLNTNNTGP